MLRKSFPQKDRQTHDVSAPFFTKRTHLLVHISTMMKLAVVAALAGSAAAFAPASTGECFVVLLTFKMRFLLCIKLTFNSVILSSILCY